MGTTDHLTWIPRNLYIDQKTTVRTGHGTMDWLQMGKGVVHQGCILSLCLFNLYVDYSMWNAGMDKAQAGIKIAGRNINNLRYSDDTTLMSESIVQLKRPVMKVKEESEKVGLKLNIQKTKIMASGPITSWQMDGETMETVKDFIFLCSKITADGDCSHEIKRRLLLGRKAMTNLDCLLKSRNITLPTKVHLVKAMVFPVVMYRCESWTIKKAEHQWIDAFELWCWRRLLRVPWTARRSNQSNPKGHQSWIFIGRTDAEAEAPIVWPPNEKCQLIGKDPDAGKDWGAGGEGDDREWDGWMASLTQWTWVWAGSGSWWWTGKPGMLQSMGSEKVRNN